MQQNATNCDKIQQNATKCDKIQQNATKCNKTFVLSPHFQGSLLYVVVLRAVKERRHEPVDGVPHHRKVVALSPDALQRVPAQ